jgi:hypothetical protein
MGSCTKRISSNRQAQQTNLAYPCKKATPLAAAVAAAAAPKTLCIAAPITTATQQLRNCSLCEKLLPLLCLQLLQYLPAAGLPLLAGGQQVRRVPHQRLPKVDDASARRVSSTAATRST